MVKTHGFPVDFPNKTNPMIDATCCSEDLRLAVVAQRHARMTLLPPGVAEAGDDVGNLFEGPVSFKRDHGGELPDMHRVPGNHRIRLERLREPDM